MILTAYAIEAAIESGNIEIDPFSREQLNSASYDVTLGDEIVVYNGPGFERLGFPVSDCRSAFCGEHDVKTEPKIAREKIPDEGFVIRPGVGYLMATRERIYSTSCVPVIDGKSSLGRLFVSIHQTAGYGDPSFDGQYTLEVTTVYPIRLYAGMRIAQVRFHATQGPVMPYAGNYTGDAARGPVPSRLWKQFQSTKKGE